MHVQHILNMENDGGNCWFRESCSVLNYRLTYNDIIRSHSLIEIFFFFQLVFAVRSSEEQGYFSKKPFVNQLKKTVPNHGLDGILLCLCVCCRMLCKALCNVSQAQHKRHFLTYLQSCPMATLVYSSKVTEEHSWKLIQLLPVLHSIHLLLLLWIASR